MWEYIIGGLIGCIIFGFVTQYINNSKGYEGGFAWGFWLNIIGVIVVACKPENHSNATKKEKSSPYSTPVSESYIQERIKTANQAFSNNEYESANNAYQSVMKFYAYALDNTTIRDIKGKIKVCCDKLGVKPDIDIDQAEAKEQTADNFQNPIVSSDKDPIVLIKQLAELHSQGILSDEEFETKKAELLAKV